MTYPSTRPAVELPGINLEFPPCNLCQGDQFRLVRTGLPDRLLGRAGDWTIVHCSRCGLVQTRPRPDRASIAEVYPRSYETTLSSADDRLLSRRHRALTYLRD